MKALRRATSPAKRARQAAAEPAGSAPLSADARRARSLRQSPPSSSISSHTCRAATARIARAVAARQTGRFTTRSAETTDTARNDQRDTVDTAKAEGAVPATASSPARTVVAGVPHPRRARRRRDLPRRPEHPRALRDGRNDSRATPANFWAYVGPLVFGTIWAALLALLIALPLAIGIALFISHYAPRRLAQGLGYIIDLLAAVPSVVFGLWGIACSPRPSSRSTPGSARTSAGSRSSPRRSPAPAAPSSPSRIVLAVMVIPIITAICREVFLQTPAPPRGGRAGPRRDALGDDPDGRAAVRRAPASSRPSCSASAARSARPWRSRWCSRPRASSRSPCCRSQNPDDDRRQHRPQLPRGARRRRQRRSSRPASSCSSITLVDELDRALDRQPPQGILGSELMTTTTTAGDLRSPTRSPPASCPAAPPGWCSSAAGRLSVAVFGVIAAAGGDDRASTSSGAVFFGTRPVRCRSSSSSPCSSRASARRRTAW